MSYKLRSIKTGEFRTETFDTRKSAEEFIKDLMLKGIAAAMYFKVVAVLV